MRSADRFHSPAPEELMEYVDGEGSVEQRAAIEAHLAGCAACQALVADQHRLTGTVQVWRVPPAPSSLRLPEARAARGWWHPSRPLTAGLAAAAILLVAVAINQRPKPLSAPAAMSIQLQTAPANEAPAAVGQDARYGASLRDGAAGGATAMQPPLSAAPVAQAPQGPAQPAGRGPSVIRTARLHVVTKDFAVARESIESIVSAASGFVDHLTVTGDTTKARAVRGAIRVPAHRMPEVLTSLRRLGTVLEDTQGTQDVTDQLVDLDARMTNARATEQRLTELLRNRTGRLSDVLEIEREVARVRLDIERLDAEKTNLSRRVSYATIDVAVTEERKESIDGPVSLVTRLRIAALDGIETALDTVAAVALLLLRAGPTVVFWGCIAALTWIVVRRVRESPKPTVSE